MSPICRQSAPQDAQRRIISGSIDRRRFLAAATAAITLAGHVQAQEPAATLPWIDAHSHIWTRDVQQFPLAGTVTVDDLQPPSFTAEELLRLARQHDVGRVVLIQHHIYHGWDNSYLMDAARRYPNNFRVIGMVDNFAEEPTVQMQKLLEQKVTGLRITPWIYKEQWLAGGMDEMWQTAAQTQQRMCCLIDPQHIAEVDAMCARHPDTPVVVDHFARIGVDGTIRTKDVEALSGLARHRRTCVKISAFYALGRKTPPYLDLVPMIRRLLDAFGPERLMWGSDSPYQLADPHTYAASIDLIRQQLDFLSSEDRQWLLARTAEREFFFQ